MKRVWLTMVLCLSCAKGHAEKSPTKDSREGELQSLYQIKLIEAESLRDPDTGWLARHDCDAMIWAGRYAASDGVSGVNILAAEYPDAPGKFSRRPLPACWIPGAPDPQESATTWSRDMAVAGLLPWAWETRRGDVVQRHADYAHAHGWQAGEPTADGRAIYTPAMIGLLYKEIAGLGGKVDPLALWPAIWPAGLKDYQAHLQVMDIWLEGEIAQVLNDPTAKPSPGLALDISNTMYQRLVEHAADEPNDPWYAYVLGKYTGDQARAIALLLDPSMPMGGYVRCNEIAQCSLAHWIWTASHVLRDLKTLH